MAFEHEIVRSEGVMIRKRMRNDIEPGPAQVREEPFRIADTRDGMHRPADKFVERPGARGIVQGDSHIAVQPHLDFIGMCIAAVA